MDPIILKRLSSWVVQALVEVGSRVSGWADPVRTRMFQSSQAFPVDARRNRCENTTEMVADRNGR
jgi:hypothetical protein